MLSVYFVLAAAITAVHAEGHWIFGGVKPIATTRLDNIVSPGGIAGHVHTVAGASRFGPTYDHDDLRKSKCTTVVVQEDKSNYWTPTLYYRDPDTKDFSPFSAGFQVYYLVRTGSKKETVKAFPKGLRMLAGDPNRRSYNASSNADKAISFVCLDYAGGHQGDEAWKERPNLFEHGCPNGLRAQVFFPSCWDGKNLDSPDHKSHMAYPVENYNSGNCPASHPVHLVSLFYEMIVDTPSKPYSKGSWVFSNGDPTGYGFHGDFVNGWDVNLLQDAIDHCPNARGNVEDCPPLKARMDKASASACTLEGTIVDEEVGTTKPLAALPGCNPVWDGNGAKPTCASLPVPALKSPSAPPSGWTEIGCISEGKNGRALKGANFKDPAMTRAKCADFCASKGFKLAGLEFSSECFCDSELRNGATANTIEWTKCATKCAGNSYEICGGSSVLSLLSNTGSKPVPAISNSSPSSTSTPKPPPVLTAQPPDSAPPAPTTSTPITSTPGSKPPVTISTPGSKPPVTISTPGSKPPVTTSTPGSKPPVTGPPADPPSTQVPDPASPPTNSTADIPAGWSAVGCIQDTVANRVLASDMWTSAESMTIARCVAHCDRLGHTLAGVEYARECFCGKVFSNGGGAKLAATKCNMACTGKKGEICGGENALNVFKKGAAPQAAVRRHKARQFGRGLHADPF